MVSRTHVISRCVAKVCHKGNVVIIISFIVVSGKKPAILGVDTCERLGHRSKCEFGVKKLVFIGDVLTEHGVQPDECKISAIVNMTR